MHHIRITLAQGRVIQARRSRLAVIGNLQSPMKPGET